MAFGMTLDGAMSFDWKMGDFLNAHSCAWPPDTEKLGSLVDRKLHL